MKKGENLLLDAGISGTSFSRPWTPVTEARRSKLFESLRHYGAIG
jgi:hypothetical protein